MSSVPQPAQSAEQDPGRIPDQAWRKFHKVTPLSKAGALWIILIAILFNFIIQIPWEDVGKISAALRNSSLTILLVALGAMILITILVIGFSALSWKYMSFAIVESGIHLRSGIFVKKHQHMRWDRIQSVEIEQTLFGRIFGFGTVVVDSAAQSEEATRLGLLRMADCASLRQEILMGISRARAGQRITGADGRVLSGGSGEQFAGSVPESQGAWQNPAGPSQGAWQGRADEPGSAWQTGSGQQGTAWQTGAAQQNSTWQSGPAQYPSGPGEPTQSTEIPVFDPDDTVNDRLIFELPTGRLVASTLLSAAAMGAILGIILLGVATFFAGEAIIGTIILVVTTAFGAIKSIFGLYGTKLYISEHGLRLRSGLTKLTTRTIPPQRIHAIKISQTPLWRIKGWWRIEVGLAGQDSTDENGIARIYVMPAGTRAELEQVLWTMIPSLGTDNDAAMLEEGLTGRGDGRYFTGTPKSARWLDPISRPARGLAMTPTVFASRTGRIWRTLSITPQDRNQSLTAYVGPIQRRLGLASLQMCLVSGIFFDVDATNYDRDFIENALWTQAQLTAAARDKGVTESIDEWRTRVGV